MSQHPPAWDEPLTEMRADARLRAFAKLDSLEPSRAVDRAVLGLARAAASGGAHRSGPGLRWAFPAAIAAAAVCAAVVHRPASRPGTPRLAEQRFILERMQPSTSPAIEMVRVSAHYHGSGESQRTLLPLFIDASVPLLSIRAAPLRKRGAEEQAPRVAARSSDRASRRERELTMRRRTRPPELIDSVALDSIHFVEMRPGPPPRSAQPALQSAGTSGGARVQDARAEATRPDPH